MIKFNEEVYFSGTAITCVSDADIEFLKSKARLNKRLRCRLCTHPNADDSLHEMLIVHAKGCYVPPHKHVNKSESFHVIEGNLKVVIFDEAGEVVKVIEMGPKGSGGVFYYRLSEDSFHTVIPLSDQVVFHETTNGPFRREETIFAAWAPAEDEPEQQAVYLETLAAKL